MKPIDVLTSPWAIVPAKLSEIREIYLAHLRGPKIDWGGMEARILGYEGEDKEPYCINNGVAVIHVQGVLTKGMSFFSRLFGGSSMSQIGEAVKQASEDVSAKSILLYIDSPGGTVDGTQELAEAVYSARAKKPVVAFTDGMMTSAAYWIGSAADKVYIGSDTTEVGSIGTIYTHIDQSAWDAQMGDKYTHITAGKYKDLASPHKPLSEDARAYIQERVDYINNVFVEGIAKNRGVTREKAVSMADGARIYMGKQAIDGGLVDGVSTFDALIERMAAGSAGSMYLAKSEQEGMMDITELKEKHPQIYQAVFDAGKAEGTVAGHQAGIEAGKAEGVTAGALAERQRIADVKVQFIPGHEALIEAMIQDGKTTGPEAAVRILAAEKQIRADAQKKLDADAKDLNGVNALDNDPSKHDSDQGAKTLAEAGNNLDKLAKAKQAEKKCTYSEAFAAVCIENPKLAAIYQGRKEA
ncbi:MAG: S49 family peptidase [Candidatus Omnitrophota bacterium]